MRKSSRGGDNCEVSEQIWYMPRGFRWQGGDLTWLGRGGAHSVDGCRPKLIVRGHYHRNYRTKADLGYGRASVAGLGMDGTEFDENMWIADTDEVTTLAR